MEPPGAFLFERGELQAGMARFFNHEAFSDLVLVAPDHRRLRCHRVVLAACSELLAATLASGPRPGEALPVTGVDSDALEAVVRHFYEGRLLLTPRNAVPVLDAALRLRAVAAAGAARAYLRSVLQPGTAVALLGEALRFEVDDLAEEALACAVLNFDEAAASPDFIRAPAPLVARLLRAAKASGLRPARALLAAAWRWLSADPSHAQHFDDIVSQVASPDLGPADVLSAVNSCGGAQMQLPASLALLLARSSAGLPPPAAALPLQLQQHPAVVSSTSQLQQLAGLLEGAGAAGVNLIAALTRGQGGGQRGGHRQQLQQLAAAVLQQQPEPQHLALQLEQQQQQQQQQGHGRRQPTSLRRPSAEQQGSQQPAAGEGPRRSLCGHELGAAVADGAARPVGRPSEPGSQQPDAVGATSPMSAGRRFGGATPHGTATGEDSAALDASETPAVQPAVDGCGSKPSSTATGCAEAQAAEPLQEQGQPQQQQLQRMPPPPLELPSATGRRPRGSSEALARAFRGRGSSRCSGRATPTGGAGGGNSGVLGARSSGGAARGTCQVDGCHCDLSMLREYHQRYRICEAHLKSPAVTKDGQLQRFCQQCGRFHPVEDFDGSKRSCRDRLFKHNARRRKRGDPPAGLPAQPAPSGGSGGGVRKRRAGGSSEDSDGSDDEGAAPAARTPWTPPGGGSFGSGGGGAPNVACGAGTGADGVRGGAVATWALNMLASAAGNGSGADDAAKPAVAASGAGAGTGAGPWQQPGMAEAIAAAAAAAAGGQGAAGALQAVLAMLGPQGGAELADAALARAPGKGAPALGALASSPPAAKRRSAGAQAAEAADAPAEALATLHHHASSSETKQEVPSGAGAERTPTSSGVSVKVLV